MDVPKVLKPVDIIKAHWKELTSNDLLGLTNEFLTIEALSAEFHHSFSNAELNVGNRAKNRYTNVLASDASRVTISLDETNSDYVNANWIEGQKYIAAQGPQDHTVVDFWRMVWEHNVSVITMLTREWENGNCKCSIYWPSSALIYGPFVITQTNITENAHQIIHRTFQIFHTETEATRVVQHFQYTGWPDHGLPDSPEAFIHLVDAIWASNQTKGPLAVHCSAGIGRTGTLICVDIVTNLLRSQYKDNLNGQPPEFFRELIFNTVLELRRQRVGMVQTREQYYYCYLAVLAMSSPSFRKMLIKRKRKFDEQQAKEALESQQTMEDAMSEADTSCPNSARRGDVDNDNGGTKIVDQPVIDF